MDSNSYEARIIKEDAQLYQHEGAATEGAELPQSDLEAQQINLISQNEEDSSQPQGDNGPQNPATFITDDFLQVLDEHRKICEKEGKLDEAQAARKRLKELKIINENRKRELLVSNHQQEMQALENAHVAEIKELLAKWNNFIIPNFENEASLLELELKKRQQNELEAFKEQIEIEQDQQKVYFSSDVLDLKRRLEVLGNQGAYKEAKSLKKKLKDA